MASALSLVKQQQWDAYTKRHELEKHLDAGRVQSLCGCWFHVESKQPIKHDSQECSLRRRINELWLEEEQHNERIAELNKRCVK